MFELVMPGVHDRQAWKKSRALATVPACPPGRLVSFMADPVVPGLRTGLHHRLALRAPSGSSWILDLFQRRTFAGSGARYVR